MTPEGKVKKKVKEILVRYGFWYCTPATGGYGRSGVPDYLACKAGRFFAIECKANGNKPTVLQQSEMDAIKQAGGTVLVVDENNLTELEELLSCQ